MIEPYSLPLKTVPPLASGTMHLWWLDLDRVGMAPGLQRQGRSGLRMQQRFLLRLLLGAYLRIPGRDVVLERNEVGKPVLRKELAEESGIRFNLSHAGRCMAIAIGQEIVPGVDIESVSRKIDGTRMAARWFGAVEAELIRHLDPEQARVEFLRRWTAREALIKAKSSTIAASLGSICLSAEDPKIIEHLPADWPAPASWQLKSIEHPGGWLVHLACSQPIQKLRQFDLGRPAL